MDQDEAHVRPLELDLVLLDGLDLDRVNAVGVGELLVVPGLGRNVPLVGADVVEPVVEELLVVNGILLQQVAQILLDVVVGRGQVAAVEDVDGQRLREGGDHLPARFGKGQDPAPGQIEAREQREAGHVDQHDDQHVHAKLDEGGGTLLLGHCLLLRQG